MADIATNWVDNIGMSEDAAYLNALGTAVNNATHATTLSGTFASLPAASSANTGAHYFCTDCDSIYKSDGSAWKKIRIGGTITTNVGEPPSTSLTTSTLGSATFTSDKDGRLLTCPSASGDNWRIEYTTLSPTSNYTATAYLDLHAVDGNYQNYGLVVLNSGSGSLIKFGPGYSSGWNVGSTKYTNVTTFSADYSNKPPSNMSGNRMPNWFRIRDDATNRYYEYSFNGIDWILNNSTTRTDFITPDRIGWGANNSGGNTIYLRCRSLIVT